MKLAKVLFYKYNSNGEYDTFTVELFIPFGRLYVTFVREYIESYNNINTNKIYFYELISLKEI